MLNLKRLGRVGWGGLAELIPLLSDFAGAEERHERLRVLYGARPVLALLAIGAAAALLGQLFARVGPAFPFKEHVHWGAAVLAALLGLRIRRFLFDDPASRGARFADLALSIAPAMLALLVTWVIAELVFGPSPRPADGFADPSGIGSLLLAVTELAGIVAAVTIAVASLCYSRNWLNALWDLAIRLAIFKFLVWLTALIMIEIGIIGMILGAVLEALTGLSVPEWLKTLTDQLTYALLLLTAYGFVIGGTWRICRQTWPELQETGDVNIARALEDLAKDKDG